jgi:hypothetical protein
MSAWEREIGELPVPNLPLSGRKAGRGLFVLLHRRELLRERDGLVGLIMAQLVRASWLVNIATN